MKKHVLGQSLVCMILTLFFSGNLWGQTFNFVDGAAVSSPAGGWTNSSIGTYFRSTSTSALTFTTVTSCNGYTKANTSGSGTVYFRPDIDIAGIAVWGTGTGNNRTFTSIATSSTIGGTYTVISGASATGIINSATCGSISVTNTGTIAAGTFIRIVLSGNINTTSFVLTPACATPPAITSVTAAANPICSDATTNLTANGVNGISPVVTWFTGPGGTGSNLGTGTSLNNVGPGTYYARVTGTCGSPAESSITINAKTNAGITSVTAPSANLCPGATQTLTANGVVGTNAVVNWYTGSGATGTNLGTGTTLPGQGPGTYYAYVTGDCGAPAEASLTVGSLSATGVSTVNLAAASYPQGTPSGSVTPLSVSGSGSGTLSYQWFSSTDASNATPGDDNPVGTNSNSYTPSTVTVGVLYFYCVVTGSCSPAATSAVSGAIEIEAPTTPTIVVDQTGFNGVFGNKTVNSSTAPQSLLVSGSALTEDISVNAPAGFEVSLSAGGGYGSAVSLTQSGGTVSNTTVYVRFSPVAETPYSGNVSFSSTGATTIDVAVSGTGTIPSITINETALDFLVTGWTASTAQSKSISGSNLDDVISVTVDAPFQVSNDNSTWNTSTSYTPSSGSVSGTLYVRYNPSSGSGDDNGNVSISSTGAVGKSFTVTGKAAPQITLSSGSDNQSVKAGTAITNIVYTVTGGITGSSASGLPSGVTYNDGTFTISGSPGFETSYPANYNFTVTVTGPTGTSNATANGSISVKEKNIAYVVNTGTSGNDTQIRPLLANKHNVTNILIASVTTSTDFSAYDAVVLTELPASGSAGMRALWGINKPLLNMKAFATQSNTWIWGSGVNATGSTQVDVINANHPIFKDVTISGGKVTMLSGVGGSENGLQGSTYLGGINLAYMPNVTSSVAINEIAAGSDPNGATTTTGATNQSSQAKYLMVGIADISWNNLTADGLKVVDNAIQYLTKNSIVATAGANGSISPAGTTFLENGQSQSYTITADPSFAIGDVLVDGVSQGAISSYTFNNVTTDHTISVTFVSGCQNVAITGASASPAGPLCSGQTTTLSAEGVSGTNAVVNWYIGPGGSGSLVGTGLSLGGVGAGTYFAYVTGDCGEPVEAFVSIGSAGNTFSGSGNWTDGGNWSCGAAPTSGDAVTIADGASVTLNTSFTVDGSFTMGTGSSLTINPDVTLAVGPLGSADFNGQAVTIKSTATGYGAIGQVEGTLTGATNVTVERFLPNNGFRGWRLLSVPTSGSQTIKQAWQEGNAPLANNVPGFGTLITGGGNNTGASQAIGFDFSGPNTSMQFWNGTGWSNVSGTLGALSARQAYFLYVRGDRSKTVTGLTSDAGSTTLRSNGAIYTGSQNFTVPAGQFQVIPNLYPSAISFTGLTRTGIANSYTVWDAKTQVGSSLGRYVTFSGTSGWEPNVSSNSYPLAGAPYTTIESGQAIFVQDNTSIAGDGSVTLVESAKTSASANGNLGLRPVKRASLRTTLSNAEGELDGNVAVFDAAFSNTLDGDDAQKMGNPGANIGIEADGKLLSVEGRQPAKAGDMLQFRMWNLNSGNYTLKLEAGNIAQAGVEAVLEDGYTKTISPVQLNGSTAVSFTVDANSASKAANRFRVVFRKGISGVEATPAVTVAPNPVTGGTLNLRFNNQPEGRYTVRVVGLNGQVLLSRVVAHSGGNGNQVLNLGSRFASGNYRLEVISPAKVRSVQNLLIKH